MMNRNIGNENVRMISQVVSVIFATISLCGYIIFVIGYGLFHKELSKEELLPALLQKRWVSVLTPMFVFGGLSIPLYLVTYLRIFFRHGNKKHILHSILMFLYFFYMIGGGTTLLFGGVALIHELDTYLSLKTRVIAPMTAGCLIAITFHWFVMITWSLSKIELRCHRRGNQYQELLHSAQHP